MGELLGWITHDQLVMIARDFWKDDFACEHFLSALNKFIITMNYKVDKAYHIPVELEAVVHFCKSRKGCTDSACRAAAKAQSGKWDTSEIESE
ncbi:hypothetical protein NQ042_01370 [Corynebacterium phoceense]|uniref:hypothetical protein n=1 Tax=Corynebacterium phoceense TaxID=1686286 RepID=UPI00211CC964|nr:hypothetical protein [Corynebacterium phoceense]MCQ9332758.1 hypothetical protein [Corynebacterium phoceense]